MTRRPGKPRPVQGQTGSLTRPGEIQVGRRKSGFDRTPSFSVQGRGEMDCRPRQDPAYRPAKEKAPRGLFYLDTPTGSPIRVANDCEFLLILSELMPNPRDRIEGSGGPDGIDPRGESLAVTLQSTPGSAFFRREPDS